MFDVVCVPMHAQKAINRLDVGLESPRNFGRRWKMITSNMKIACVAALVTFGVGVVLDYMEGCKTFAQDVPIFAVISAIFGVIYYFTAVATSRKW